MDEQTRKISLNIPGPSEDQLNDICRTKQWKVTDAVRKAIAFYHWFLEHEKNGDEVTIEVKTKEGEVRRIQIPLI